MTNTALKTIALILMVIDHIGLYIPGMPICLRWIGRLSAPIFLFCLVEGIEKTHNRKQYLLRLYIFNIGMALMNTVFNLMMPEYPRMKDNIFQTYFSVAACVMLLEWSRKKYQSIRRGIAIIVGWQIADVVVGQGIWELVSYMSGSVSVVEQLFISVIGLFSFGGQTTFFVIYGIILYYIRKEKKKLIIGYTLMSTIPYFLIFINFPQNLFGTLDVLLIRYLGVAGEIITLTVVQFAIGSWGFECFFRSEMTLEVLLTENYQWMMIGALPFMLCYNGKRGRGMKYFFYVFYPLHISILAILRCYL